MNGKRFRVFDDLFWKYMLAYKKRTGFVIMGVVLSVILFFGSATVYTSFQYANRERVKALQGNYDMSGMVSPEEYRKLKELDYVEEVLLVQEEGTFQIERANDANISMEIQIQNLERWNQSIFFYNLKEGQYPKNAGEIILDQYLAAYFDVGTGDTLDLELSYYEYTPDGTGQLRRTERSFLVSGIYDTKWSAFSGNQSGSQCELPILGQIDKDVNYRSLNVCVRFRHHRNYTERLLEDGIFLTEHYSLTEYLSGYQEWSSETLEYIVFMLVFIVMFWLAVLIIRNVFVMSVAERARDYGILRCMGCSQYHLRRLLMKEGIATAVIGSVLGMGISLLLIEGGRYLGGIRQILIDMDIYPFFHAKVAWWSVGITVILILGAVLFSLLEPARQIGLLAPSDAISGHASIKKERFHRSHTGWIRKLFGIEGEYAYKNLLRNRGKFFVSTAGIALSVAGIVLSVSVFQIMEFILKIENNTRGGYNATAVFDNGIGKTQTDVEQFVEDLMALKSVEDAHPVYSIHKFAYRIQQENVQPDESVFHLKKDARTSIMATMIDREEMKELQEVLIEGSLDYEALQQGGAIICRSYYDYDAPHVVNGQLVVRKLVNQGMSELQVGDMLLLPKESFSSQDMTDQQLEETVNQIGYRLVPIVAILDYYPSVHAFSSDVLFAEEYFQEEIVTADTPACGLNSVRIKYSQAYNAMEMMEFRMEHLNYWIYDTEGVHMLPKLRGYRQLILLLALLIAGIGAVNIFQTLSSNIALRHHEFQVMRTIGMSRKQIVKMLGLEGGMAAIFGGLLGIGFGMGIGYYLTKFAMELRMPTNAGEVYYQIAYQVPWPGIGVAVLLAGCITGMSIWIAKNELGEGEENDY